MAVTTTTTYDMLDLVRERAFERDWEPIFDGPNGDSTVLIWEKHYHFTHHAALNGKSLPDRVVTELHELEIHFTPDGRIGWSEKRRDGEPYHRNQVGDPFGSTDVQIETLRMI